MDDDVRVAPPAKAGGKAPRKGGAFKRVFWLLLLMVMVGGAAGWLFAQDMLTQSKLRDLMMGTRPKPKPGKKDVAHGKPGKPGKGAKPGKPGKAAKPVKPAKTAGKKPAAGTVVAAATPGVHAASPAARDASPAAHEAPPAAHGEKAGGHGAEPAPSPTKSEEEEREEDPRRVMWDLSQRKGPHVERLRAQLCATNLQTLAVALRNFAQDHDHAFPMKLTELRPRYLKGMPVCPSAHADTYTVTYEANVEAELYTVSCSGRHHGGIGLASGFPRLTRDDGIQIK